MAMMQGAARRVVVVGGVAGGASCAAWLRRLTETAEITIYERGANVSFANCGLPYYVSGVIPVSGPGGTRASPQRRKRRAPIAGVSPGSV